jgi:hypothetical protein
MTQQEFEKRTAIKLSAEEYAAVERDYMGLPEEAGNFKDRFCELWVEAGCQRTERSVADFLLVEIDDENKFLWGQVRFHDDLIAKALVKMDALEAEIKALKGVAA